MMPPRFQALRLISIQKEERVIVSRVAEAEPVRLHIEHAVKQSDEFVRTGA